MMHTSWMAASASCERTVQPAGVSLADVPVPDAHAHHHAPQQTYEQARSTETPAPQHHTPSASCPMAMACSMNVITSALPTIEVVTVGHATTLPTFVADAPHWALVAPEPPPPRG
ncbi:MAG: hypothetical protein K2R93_11215 [Gemmatimonadaceae bacterium]|nr:hypothetical protein [Gemmatimonadaceae bacterium]